MSMTSRLIQRGISLWKSGQITQARGIFKTILNNEPGNETAWLWYIFLLETNREKIAALESFLAKSPQNQKAKLALESLRAEQVTAVEAVVAQPVAVPAPPSGAKTAPIQAAQRPKNLPAPKTQQPRPAQVVSRSVPAAKSASAPRPAFPWPLALTGVLCIVCSLLVFFVNYTNLVVNYEDEKQARQKLSTDFGQLNTTYRSLYNEHADVIQRYNGLLAQFNGLQTEYQSTVNRYSELENKYNTLNQDYSNLSQQYNNLTLNYDNLNQDYITLNNIAIKPPYIVVHDRQVDTSFYDIDNELITWNVPFDTLEEDLNNGAFMRKLIVDLQADTSLVYTRNERKLALRNFSTFVTPSTFRNVIPPLYQKSASNYEFIYRIWYMIGQLSSYASEDIETPRYPLETLLAGGGDCEDLSILFASMIRAAPVNWEVDLLYVDADNISDPQTSNHVVVYINTGEETYVVETTENEVMLPYTDGISGWRAKNLSFTSQHKYPDYFR